MKPIKLLTIALTSWLMLAATLPAAAERERMRRNITFIVRKADKVKNIAARFHVRMKEMKPLNAHLRKNQIVYAGKALVVPVWLKRKSHLQRESSDFSIADFALDQDSLDAYIGEDFVNMMDVETDTVRRAMIDKEIRLLDRKLNVLYVKYDSVLREENAAYADLSLRDQKKLMISRMRNNPHAALDAAIDTLTKQKARLNAEKSGINARVADYENLIDNAAYAAAHPEEAQVSTIHLNEWADDPDKTPAQVKSKK
ncbi:MAG: hypothetical protein JST83_12140 [Bacteroidetes bacterium]|nr:hypothetical protein [Bacteroidota bacterium]